MNLFKLYIKGWLLVFLGLALIVPIIAFIYYSYKWDISLFFRIIIGIHFWFFMMLIGDQIVKIGMHISDLIDRIGEKNDSI